MSSNPARALRRQQARRLAKAAEKIAGSIAPPPPAGTAPPAAKDAGEFETLFINCTTGQAEMLVQAQNQVNAAQAQIQVIAATIVAGDGRKFPPGVQVVRVTDTKPPKLEVRVPKKLRKKREA